MPVPAVPKRAAPPRRKAPKSPSPAPAPPAAEQAVESATEVSESPTAGTPQLTSDDGSKVLQDAVHKSLEDEAALGLEPAEKAGSVPEPPKAEEPAPAVQRPREEAPVSEPVHEQDPVREVQDSLDELALDDERDRGQDEEPREPKAVPEAGKAEETVVEEPKPDEPTPVDEAAEEPEAPQEPHAEEPKADEEEEEDENARRKRIAERLRQQGGFNPFAAPPPMPSRKSTADVPKSPAVEESHARDVEMPPPVLPETANAARRESIDLSAPSVASLASPPLPSASTRPVPERKASVQVTHGEDVEEESKYAEEEDDGK